MAWRMRVKWYESCSCRSVCRCTLGHTVPDQEWCSGAFVMEVLSGESDGVDLTGAKLAMSVELPGDFLGGIDKARLYLDDGLSDTQRSELEAIVQGNRGGMWAGLKEAIASWIPSKVTSIEIADGDAARITVGGAGEIRLQAIRTEDGRQAVLTDAPVSAAIGQDVLELATATASWSDPDLRAWESLGHGGTSFIEWSA